MRLKLDENLGPQIAQIFADAGHDALLVVDQGLSGTTDDEIADVCREEDRCLVTLDLDFANILRYPPSAYPGIAVLRVPDPMSVRGLKRAAETLADALVEREIVGKLWVVARGRVREYWEEEE